ncbi:MAG: DciA family protein, partial [Chromatiales bacterium]|nr:DciA family protein [Chromatiales bacterium]
DKTLILYTVSSAWASRLRFISRQLTGQLKGKGIQIENISVRVQLQHQPQKRPARRIRNLGRENATLIEQLADHIEDDKLSAALRRLSRHKNRQH